ncbi:TIGR04104 family putative zinc finger protein [Planococcus sp. ISL-109]|uniref:TIGR04104 family putative zinc finger protein n=1 Tax=Planococcus sp. ISL-109 TaxID=2819166 RepID=UPI001BE54767|nr:hypothetical protein [Planococcus sp. ISL-109]
MPHCQNCGTKWNWADSMKLSFKGKKECPNCHKNQYVSSKSTFWGTLLFSMPFVFLMSYLRSYYEVGFPVIVLAFIIYMPLVSLLMPFIFKLSSTRKRFGKTVD